MAQRAAQVEPAGASGIGRRRAAARDESSETYQSRRAEIRAAAADMFKVHGFRGTSIGRIASVLGIDRATLYYYIGSKEELFDEVVTDAVRANVKRAEAIRAGEGAVPEKLRTLVEDLMVSYAESYPFLYVFIQENLSHVDSKRSAWSKEMRALNKRYERVVVDLIQEGIDDGTIRPVAEAWVMGYGLIGMVAWTNRWFNPESSQVDATQIGRAYADVLLRGMVTGSPGTRSRKPAPSKAGKAAPSKAAKAVPSKAAKAVPSKAAKAAKATPAKAPAKRAAKAVSARSTAAGASARKPSRPRARPTS